MCTVKYKNEDNTSENSTHKLYIIKKWSNNKVLFVKFIFNSRQFSALGFVKLGPFHCVDLFVFICVHFVFFFILHSCIIVSTVGWTCWDWTLILRTLSSFSALTLLVGSYDLLKLVPDMTFHVFVGMLNLAQPSTLCKSRMSVRSFN